MRIAISLCLMFVAVAAIESQSPPPEGLSARQLDALLQERAFEALSWNPKTGVVFQASVPESLAGIQVSALRLRSGSLKSRGVKEYREFGIPMGVTLQPYTKRLVLVYHNLANLSSRFYPLPGFDYVAPVLGLIAYDASNLTTVGPPELDLSVSDDPIAVRFGDVAPPDSARCVFFDLHGSVQFDRAARGGECEVAEQGHVSLVVESTAPSPEPSAGDFNNPQRGRAGSYKGWKIGGCLVGALVLVGGIVLFLPRVRAWRNNKLDGTNKRDYVGVGGADALQITSFGGIKAPFARVTRTQPVLEDRYVA